MNNSNVRRNYGVSLDQLSLAANTIGDAIKDERHQAVVERMPNTFPTDYAAAAAALAKAIADQSGARGSVGTAAGDKSTIGAECQRSLGTVRRIARRALAGQTSVLHAEFTVGDSAPKGIASIIARAEKVHAACVKYAEILAAKGWGAAETTRLGEQIAALKSAQETRHEASAEQHTATGQQINMANTVYDLIRSVQIVANDVYPVAKTPGDATAIGARDAFLLGAFPPPNKRATPEDPTGQQGTTGSTGATAAGSGASASASTSSGPAQV